LSVVGLGGTTTSQPINLTVAAVTTTTPATTTTTTTTTTVAPGALVNPLGFNGNYYYWNKSSSGPSSITLKFQSNGAWSLVKASTGTPNPSFSVNSSPASWSDSVGGNWFTPTTTNAGNGYLIKFTSNDYNFAGGGSTTLSGDNSGWLVLNQDRTQQVSVTSSGGDAIYVAWRVDIAVNNSGSPGAIVATGVIEFDGNHD
jgi:hypothetical protein